MVYYVHKTIKNISKNRVSKGRTCRLCFTVVRENGSGKKLQTCTLEVWFLRFNSSLSHEKSHDNSGKAAANDLLEALQCRELERYAVANVWVFHLPALLNS